MSVKLEEDEGAETEESRYRLVDVLRIRRVLVKDLADTEQRKHAFQLVPVPGGGDSRYDDLVLLDVSARSALQKRKWISEIQKAHRELKNTMLNEDEVLDRR